MEFEGKIYSEVVIRDVFNSPSNVIPSNYIRIIESVPGYVNATPEQETVQPPEVEKAFVGGSMFGWSTPASNPYDSVNQVYSK